MTEPMPPEPRDGAGPTEPDEEQVLGELYDKPDDGSLLGEESG